MPQSISGFFIDGIIFKPQFQRFMGTHRVVKYTPCVIPEPYYAKASSNMLVSESRNA
jgi:hypothetical protein